MPLSYTSPPSDNDPSRMENRPDLKCPGCGQCYQWQDFAGWAPMGFPTTMSDRDAETSDTEDRGHARLTGRRRPIPVSRPT